MVLGHDGHHVQKRCGQASSQFYHPCPCGKFRSKTPSGDHRDREARFAVVRPPRHTIHPTTNYPFSVYKNSVRTLASPPTLCGHGPAVRAKTSRCAQTPSYRLHIITKQGLPGHILCVCDTVKPLGFITHILRFPHRKRSGMSEDCPYQGGGACRNAPQQKISRVQSRFCRQEARQDEPGGQEPSTTNRTPPEPS